MMNSTSAIDIPESRDIAKGKAPLVPSTQRQAGGPFSKGIAIFDFVIRIGAIVTALTAASTMGTSDETLPFFSQFFQFEASYDDLPAFQFFVIAMALVGAYLVLSLPFSIVCIVRPHSAAPRLLLLILDTVALTLDIAAGAAATAIVYLAHNGNASTNWLAICNQFGDFCERTSGATVASLISVALLLALLIMSALALKNH